MVSQIPATWFFCVCFFFNKMFMLTVFKTNGRPVTTGDHNLDWPSYFFPWASKNYNRLYKEGNHLNVSGWVRENFSLKHCVKNINISGFKLLALWGHNGPVTGGFPSSQRASNMSNIFSPDVIIGVSGTGNTWQCLSLTGNWQVSVLWGGFMCWSYDNMVMYYCRLTKHSS